MYKRQPYDNARAERFMRTLKQEEVYASQYRDLDDARARIGEFLEQVYNYDRLHAALDYQPPAEFEQKLLAAPETAASKPAETKAVETDGADGNPGKPQSRFPTVSHSSLEIPEGFPLFPQPTITSS